MSDVKKRKFHEPEYKAKIGLEAVRGVKTIIQIAQEYNVHPVQVGQYKKHILAQASHLFDGKRGPKPVNGNLDPYRHDKRHENKESATQAASIDRQTATPPDK